MNRRLPGAARRATLDAQASNAGALLLLERQHCARVVASFVNVSGERPEAAP